MVVRLYGMIAEKAGAEQVEVQASNTVELVVALREHVPGLDTLSYALAVDRTIVNESVNLTGKEEVAVLPPFAGG